MKNTQLTDILIDEGLIKSLSFNSMMGAVEKWISNYDGMSLRVRHNIDIIITFDPTISASSYHELLRYVNACGWFISSICPRTTYTWRKYDPTYALKLIQTERLDAIAIEPKYDSDTTSDTTSRGYLYHVSPAKYDERILKIGLIPKSKSKLANHPERIYLTKTEKDAEFLADKFTTFDGYGIYTIYKIDIHKLIQQNKNIKFYKDPAFPERGIYVTVNIPPSCIQVVKTKHI